MYVIDYITPDRCGHIILAATEADAAEVMGKALAETGMPPQKAVDIGSVVTLYLKAKGSLIISGEKITTLVINGITLSPISQETFESMSRDLFPSLQQ